MVVRVKLYGIFRHKSGKGEIKISVDSIKDLLKNISEQHEELREEIFDNGKDLVIKDFVTIAVNGRRIELLDGIDTKLEDGDTVMISPPLAGGYSNVFELLIFVSDFIQD